MRWPPLAAAEAAIAGAPPTTKALAQTTAATTVVASAQKLLALNGLHFGLSEASVKRSPASSPIASDDGTATTATIAPPSSATA